MVFQKENEKITLVHQSYRLILNYKTMRHQGYKMHWRFLRCCFWMIRVNTNILHSVWHHIHDMLEKTKTMKRSEIVKCCRKFIDINTTQPCSVKWKHIIEYENGYFAIPVGLSKHIDFILKANWIVTMNCMG